MNGIGFRGWESFVLLELDRRHGRIVQHGSERTVVRFPRMM